LPAQAICLAVIAGSRSIQVAGCPAAGCLTTLEGLGLQRPSPQTRHPRARHPQVHRRKEDILIIGPPGTGQSHIAKALATTAVQRGCKVLYREAHQLIEDITEDRELGDLRKLRAQIRNAELLLIDDLFLRKLLRIPAIPATNSPTYSWRATRRRHHPDLQPPPRALDPPTR
jgi:hypothetical protein